MLNIICLIFIFFGCSNKKKINLEIEKIPLKIKFDRFDLKFADVNKKEFQNLKKNIIFYFQFNSMTVYGLKEKMTVFKLCFKMR